MEEALEVCWQIAKALGAAHEKGTIHRDLKPANIKFTPEEEVKVLDFGIGKALPTKGLGDEPTDDSTLTAGTLEGRVMGTASFMGPEQLRGEALDRRTDSGGDRLHSERVSIVSESIAGTFWDGQDPIGKTVSEGPRRFRVVGVVGGTGFRELRRSWHSVYFQPRFNALVSSVFAFLAVALAAIRLYATVTASVAYRTREMRIRLAVGATPSRIGALLLALGLRLTFWVPWWVA